MIEPRDVLEALLFASEAPVEPTVIRDVLDLPSPEAARELVDDLRQHLEAQGRVLQIVEVGGGFRLVTRPDVAPWLVKLARSKTKSRLSRPALETLAIIAYRQPVSRPEVDATRGVNSEGVLDNLLERRLIRISGRKETAGRPFLYETTREFLVAFGLRDLGDLPKVDGDLVIIDPAADASADSDVAADSDAASAPDGSDLDVGQTPGDVDEDASAVVDEIEPPSGEVVDIDEAAVGAAIATDANAPARRVAELDVADTPGRDVSTPERSTEPTPEDSGDAPSNQLPWEAGEVPTTPSESLDDAESGRQTSDTLTTSAPAASATIHGDRAQATRDEPHGGRADASRDHADSDTSDARDAHFTASDGAAGRAESADATRMAADVSADAVAPASDSEVPGAADSPQQDPGAGGPDVAARR